MSDRIKRFRGRTATRKKFFALNEQVETREFFVDSDGSDLSESININGEECGDKSASSDEEVSSLKTVLSSWATRNKAMPCTAVDEILVDLAPFHPGLPRNHKTLLQTPKACPVQPLGGGRYVHVGISDEVRKFFEPFRHLREATATIDVHSDGIEVANSSKQKFWSIIGMYSDREIFWVYMYG